MNLLPLYAHGQSNVIKIMKQIQNDPSKVRAKIKEAQNLDISYLPYQQNNDWALLDNEKYNQNGSVIDCLTKAVVFSNENTLIDLLSSLRSENLVIIVDVEHKDKILSVINKYDIVNSRTIHAHLYLILIDLEIRVRKFYTGDEDFLKDKMKELHRDKYNEIIKDLNLSSSRNDGLTFFDLIPVQYLAEIYVKYNHAKLGPQRAQVKTCIYQLRTNLVHINASNVNKIEVTGSVTDTVDTIDKILIDLADKGF